MDNRVHMHHTFMSEKTKTKTLIKEPKQRQWIHECLIKSFLKCFFSSNTISSFQPSWIYTHKKLTIDARKSQTSCKTGTALRCQYEGGVGYNLSAQSVPPAPFWSLLRTETLISLCPPESQWQQEQALLQLKVSRRLSTPLTACLPTLSLEKLEGRAGACWHVREMLKQYGQTLGEGSWGTGEALMWCGKGVKQFSISQFLFLRGTWDRHKITFQQCYKLNVILWKTQAHLDLLNSTTTKCYMHILENGWEQHILLKWSWDWKKKKIGNAEKKIKKTFLSCLHYQ